MSYFLIDCFGLALLLQPATEQLFLRSHYITTPGFCDTVRYVQKFEEKLAAGCVNTYNDLIVVIDGWLIDMMIRSKRIGVSDNKMRQTRIGNLRTSNRYTYVYELYR